MAYTHVDKPIKIGNVELKNRIVRPAHGTLYGKGQINDTLIAYHEARARGGVALSIIEVGSVHPTSALSVDLWDPALEPGYRKMMDRIRPHGMKMFQQLWHAGHNYLPRDGTPPWAPSPVPSPEAGVIPLEMTKAMIDEIVDAYATCAQRCESYGLDGVEVHCAHGYLPGQFLSLNTNLREDDYGGSFENRARFSLEILAAVRARTSRDFAVGVRLAPDLIVNGSDPEAFLQLALMMEERDLVDYVSLSIGNYSSFSRIMGGMHEPMGYQLPTSTPVTRRVKSPTIVTGRFRTLEEADQVIRNGDADMVGMVRATIADPDLVAKSLAGRAEEVRPCVGCNQACIAQVVDVHGYMECAVNPGTGHELQYGDQHLVKAPRSKKVLVVGGGPAGLEAARVAALRGHKVTLTEADSALGGTLRLAAKAPTRHGLIDIVTWLEAEVFRLGVEVRLSSYIDPDDVPAMGAEAVIVATGSEPRMDGVQHSHPGQPIHGIERRNVISSHELFQNPTADRGKSAVVIDDVGHYEALACCDMLIQQGLAVTYVTRRRGIAESVQMALMVEPFLTRMRDKPFDFLIRHRAIAIEDSEIVVGPTVFTEDDVNTRRIPADTVVFVSQNMPRNEIFQQLRDRQLGDIRVVGDANSPRFLQNAIREGHRAGAEV